jgi:hypothetical protein
MGEKGQLGFAMRQWPGELVYGCAIRRHIRDYCVKTRADFANLSVVKQYPSDCCMKANARDRFWQAP